MTPAFQPLRSLYQAVGKNEHRNLQLSTLTAVLTVLSSTGLMAFSSYIISFAAMRPDVSEILVAVTAVRFFGISRAVLRYTERMLAHNTVFRLLSRLRVSIYAGVAALSGKQLLKLDRELAFNTLTADIESLQDFYLRTFMPASISLLLGVLSTVFIACWHPLLALVFAVLYGLTHLGAAWLVHYNTRGHSAAVVDESSSYRILFTDYAEGLAEIQTCGRLNDYTAQLHSAVLNLENKGLKIAIWRSLGAQIQQMFVHLTVMLALISGIYWIQKGQIAGIFLAAITLCCFTLYESAPNMMTFFQKLESSGRSAHKILSLMAYGPHAEEGITVERGPRADDVTSSIQNTLELRNASFGYEPNHPVVQGLNLKIRTGQKVAVVGTSGSGKSTLMGLLTGLLPLDEGTLLLNDVPVSSEALSIRDDLFGIVDQGVYLFNRSLRDNLLLGNPKASDDALLEVLDQAGLLHELLSASNVGDPTEVLNTSVGLLGRHLSGGQRQRVAIARALLRQAPFLMIDEPLAGLDAVKEQEVLKTLFERYQNQGILWITHRLILMEEMHQIYVVHEGHLVEQGTHLELMNKKGHYAKMVAVQENLI